MTHRDRPSVVDAPAEEPDINAAPAQTDTPGREHIEGNIPLHREAIFDPRKSQAATKTYEIFNSRDVSACLTPYGISLLQQRQINHLTRYVVPSAELHATCANVLTEAELLEEWLLAAEAAGVDVDEAAREFHELIRTEKESGGSLQEDLKHEARRAGVRRTVVDEQRRRFG